MFVPFIFDPQFAQLAQIAAASPVAIRVAADPGRSGCPHYRTNPIRRPLPYDPVVSPYSHAWADAEFQSGRDHLPSFNGNTGIDALRPFEQAQDGSDPPAGHASAGHTVAQVVVCDRVPWGEHICSAQKLSGATVPFPQGAEPAGNSDHHYTWLDDEKRGTWDCGLRNRPTTPGARIHVGGLGFCPWDKTTPGDELGAGTDCSNATATNIETTLGSIAQTGFTAAEADSEHGTFGHAIAFSALCADPSFVAPASASDGANTNGTAACARFLGLHQRPPEGTRLYLDSSDREVDTLSLPAYDKAFLRTLDREHYGGIVTDTNREEAQGLSPAFRRDDYGAEAKEASVVPAPFAQIPLELGSIALARDVRFCASGDCR